MADRPAVMFLLDASRQRLCRSCEEKRGALGDSLVVVGGAGLWNVRVPRLTTWGQPSKPG